MKTTIAITAAALVAFSAPAFAGAHNQSSKANEDAPRSEKATDALTKVPGGLLNPNAGKGLTAAVAKSGNSDK